MKQHSKNGHVLDPHKTTMVEFMIGPSHRGPKRCLHCHKPFKKGESWQRQTSPKDSQHGSYAVGIHTACLS